MQLNGIIGKNLKLAMNKNILKILSGIFLMVLSVSADTIKPNFILAQTQDETKLSKVVVFPNIVIASKNTETIKLNRNLKLENQDPRSLEMLKIISSIPTGYFFVTYSDENTGKIQNVFNIGKPDSIRSESKSPFGIQKKIVALQEQNFLIPTPSASGYIAIYKKTSSGESQIKHKVIN